MPYIYKITNLVNNKIYIGKTSSSTIQKRFKQHINDSKKESEQHRPLYAAMKKYGIQNFKIELIEDVDTDEIASIREQYWIKELNSYVGFKNSNGYNATLGGDSRHYKDYEFIAKKFIELDKNQLKTAECCNCDVETVRKACQEYKDLTNYVYNNRITKKIKRIDPKTGEEKIYNSVTEAGYDIPNKTPETARKNISRGLNHHTLAYGYKWIMI